MQLIINDAKKPVKLVIVAALILLAGCTTPLTPPVRQAVHAAPSADPIALEPGDQLEITFLGAEELNCVQRIRRDGRLSLPIIGDIVAGGISVEKLKENLTEAYKPHLQSQVITVIVRSQPPVFVSGAVLAPGRIEMQRQLTALDAVMEAGGFDLETANLKRVVVIRHSAAGRHEYRLDLDAVLAGKGGSPFYLKPNDIVHVPKRIPWL